ncbi:MAG: hypothetical protein WC197_01665 [Candidatus Gastranaerophilaceae bacterium]|jgi:hypothetical protein
MKIPVISNSKISFSGIRGLATRTDGTRVPINLTGDDSSITIARNNTTFNSDIYVCNKKNGEKTPLEENKKAYYSNVEIDKADKNSFIKVAHSLPGSSVKIKELSDNVTLTVGSPYRSSTAFAELNKTNGDNITVAVEEGGSIYVEPLDDDCKFKLTTPFTNYSPINVTIPKDVGRCITGYIRNK